MRQGKDNLIKGEVFFFVGDKMKTQGTFEYILLLGGIIIVVLLVIAALTGAGRTTAQETNETIATGVNKIQSAVNNIEINV